MKFYNLDVIIIRRKRKTLELRVFPDKIEVRSPNYVNENSVKNFLELKKAWIDVQVRKYSQYGSLLPHNRKYNSGELFLYLGKKYELRVIDSFENKVDNDDENIYVYSKNSDKKIISKMLFVWYNKNAFEIIRKRVDYLKNFFSIKPSSIQIKDLKSCWGRCYSDGRIIFNWKIIMSDVKILDYVIIHEFSHLFHMNHGKAFWNLVKNVCPDYKIRRQWLKNYGFLLSI
jgi:hypothetical protein